MKAQHYITTYTFLGGISAYSDIGMVTKEIAEERFNFTIDKCKGDVIRKVIQLKENKHWPEIVYGMTYEQVKAAYEGRINQKLDQYSDNLTLHTFDEFLAIQAKEFADKPIHFTDNEGWWDALECLPPLNWDTSEGVEYFFMSEFYTGDYTSMYAKVRKPTGKFDEDEDNNNFIFACKTVNYKDKKSWLTKAQILSAYETKSV